MNSSQNNRWFILTGLGFALVVAALLSPLASQHPDGLDRVSQDLKFDNRASESHASRLPFGSVFNEYAVKGVPSAIATPLAGIVGTLATFGLIWGMGKVLFPDRPSDSPSNAPSDSDRP